MRVWRPRVAGVSEVLHAQWRDHAYPPHTHDTWTVLLVDDGLIGYELDRRGHSAASQAGVTLLPPYVVHDGRPATSQGFRKRVLYLDATVFQDSLIGPAVDGPLLMDDVLRSQSSWLDRALVHGHDLEAESRLALVVARVTWHLTGRQEEGLTPTPALVARRAREILDGDPLAIGGITGLAQTIGVSTAHLVRSFTRSYGIAPHRYLIGRRLDLARRRLLAGEAPVDVATATGFYDQAHFTRHFARLLSMTPGRYQQAIAPRGINDVQDGGVRCALHCPGDR